MGDENSMGDPHVEILERITRVELLLADGLRRVEEHLSVGDTGRRFLDDALEAYRERICRESGLNVASTLMAAIAERIRIDPALGFPHRKIVDVLLQEFDFSRAAFRELHFSRLVTLARVGKSNAKEYLRRLEEKGYIERRTDGYRTFYKMRRQIEIEKR